MTDSDHTPATQQSDTGTPKRAGSSRGKSRKRRILLLMLTGILVGLALFGVPTYRYLMSHESTDDAFIDGRITPVSARVSGHVARVHVADNQKVTRGELLLELDPRDFQTRLDAERAMVQNAEAMVDAANSARQEVEAQLTYAEAALAQARAEHLAAQARYRQSAADLERYRELADSNTISPQQLDHAVTAESTAAANLDAARSKVTTQQSMVKRAEATLNSARDRIRQAQAQVVARQSQLEQAELTLSYTSIYAADDGYVTKKNIEPGAFVQAGRALMSIVSPQVWVTANFKETQMTHIRPGQPATIAVDTFPEATFHGHVDSIQRGTGSRFSLLPAENASGNFVKVVQRVPVKIVFDRPGELADYLLVPGMSVVPAINIRTATADGSLARNQ